MRGIIDRLEEDFAVVEIGEKTYPIPRALVPDAREGDRVEITVSDRSTDESEDPHELFERLRRKSRRKRRHSHR